MKKNHGFVIFTLFVVFACNAQIQNTKKWTNLLDKQLSYWNNYLSYRMPASYNGTQPKDSLGNLIEPIGENKDKYGVFTVSVEKNEPILKISGEIYGCISTKQEYENYHFKAQMKWGDKKYNPRKKLLKDSGILYHSIGPNGAEFFRTWMRSIEFQVMSGHMGDFWGQNNTAVDVRAYTPEYIMNPVADKSQPFLAIGPTKGVITDYCMRSANYENPDGEWNTLELICFENKSLHIVNGQVVMILQNHRYVEDGKSVPMRKGKIQIQSEATEVYYKNIGIRKLDSLPTEYAQYFK